MSLIRTLWLVEFVSVIIGMVFVFVVARHGLKCVACWVRVPPLPFELLHRMASNNFLSAAATLVDAAVTAAVKAGTPHRTVAATAAAVVSAAMAD